MRFNRDTEVWHIRCERCTFALKSVQSNNTDTWHQNLLIQSAYQCAPCHIHVYTLHYIVRFAKPSPMSSPPLPTNIPLSYKSSQDHMQSFNHSQKAAELSDPSKIHHLNYFWAIAKTEITLDFRMNYIFNFYLFVHIWIKNPLKHFSVQHDWVATFCYLFTFVDNTNFLLIGKEKKSMTCYFSHISVIILR